MTPIALAAHPLLPTVLTGAGLLAALLFSGLYLRERWLRRRLGAELSQLSQDMTAEQSHDKLTGLLTRSGFDALLDQLVARADRKGGAFCVLYVALDNFRLLNDAFGHDLGDHLLKDAAHRLTACTGSESRACRVAAGEFALLVGGSASHGRKAAAAVIQAFAEPFMVDAAQTQLSCSVGIAAYPEQGTRAKVLGNAALAMRSVKLGGGGDFCEYDPKMGVDVRAQTVLVSELRTALEQGQLELYFQPKVDAVSLQVTAAEALLRWRHPERGFISPALFIPLAERYGLITPIGNWVIEEACRHAARWRERGLRMRVAVNISGVQMRQDDLVERIEAALARHALQPGRFTCEITESVAMEDTKVTQQTFEAMRRVGVHVSIDDFGTGYSSLATLRRLPAAELKIDRAFVCDLAESEDARSITRSIVHMATALNLRVVAEGVETEVQCRLLVEMGCDELQGYLFSMPIPADELEQLALGDFSHKKVAFRQSLFSDTLPAGAILDSRAFPDEPV